MLHIENQSINHRRHGRAQLFMQTMGNQEIRIRTVRNALRHKKKLHRGGELISLHHKLWESWESQQEAAAAKVHFKILRSALETAAQISRETHFARGSLDN